MTIQLTIGEHTFTWNVVQWFQDWWRVIIPCAIAGAASLSITAINDLDRAWLNVMLFAIYIPLVIVCMSLPPVRHVNRERHWREKARWHGNIVEAANERLYNGWTHGLKDKLSWIYKKHRYALSQRWMLWRHGRLVRRMSAHVQQHSFLA